MLATALDIFVHDYAVLQYSIDHLNLVEDQVALKNSGVDPEVLPMVDRSEVLKVDLLEGPKVDLLVGPMVDRSEVQKVDLLEGPKADLLVGSKVELLEGSRVY